MIGKLWSTVLVILRLVLAIGLAGALLATATISYKTYEKAASGENLKRREAYIRTAEYQRRGQKEKQRECVPIAAPSQRAECSEATDDRTREQERREHEVEAQEVSGVWSRASGTAALIGIGFTALTAFLVFINYGVRHREGLDAVRKRGPRTPKANTGQRKTKSSKKR